MAEGNTVETKPVETWITGIGLASSLGEGIEANWDALTNGALNVDETTYAPFLVHPLAPVNFDKQIPKRGDQRQMEPWQRIGTYIAGLALESAGIKGNAEILGRMDMIVAAGSGERDLAVDGAILTESVKGNVAPDFLNVRLQSDLRPTLFLAQLSNLLAGNISIVHGVTGSSRTFMGEEASSIDAVRVALARIASGQSDIALVGAAHNAERKDLLLVYEFGKFNLRDKFVPVWAREPNGGFALGSGGAFLVLESKQHAQARGARPFAKLSAVVADHARRSGANAASAVTDSLTALWTRLHPDAGANAIITGATGAEPATSQERRFLNQHETSAIRATGSRFGHLMEAQFPLGIALAAFAVSKGALFPPSDSTGLEIAMSARPSQIVVIGTGHWRGEGMALVGAAD